MPGRSGAAAASRAAWKSVAAVSDAVTSLLFACEPLYCDNDLSPSLAVSPSPAVSSLSSLHAWAAQLDAAPQPDAADGLTAAQRQCGALTTTLGEALAELDSLDRLYHAVEGSTLALHTQTQALLAEQHHLASLASALHVQLSHFRTLDVAAATLAHVSVRDPSFFACLARLDEAVKFVRAHPQYAAAEKHALRLSQLQQRGLTILRDHIVSELRLVASAIFRKHGDAALAAESFAYIDFRAVAPSLKPFCSELERRALDARASALLADCQNAYLVLRRQLCVPAVRANLVTLGNIPDLARSAHEGASYLASLAHLELQLYHCFFDRETASLQALLADLADLWADELRPHVLQCASAAQLCSLLQSLRSRIRAGGGGSSWLVRMAAAAQDRLVFVVQLALRDDWRDPADEAIAPSLDALDYPQRLSAAGASDRWGRISRALALLRRLRAALEDGPVFDGLAQEVLLNATAALVDAAGTLQRSAQASAVDAQLFLIKHVLLLRDETRELRVSRGFSERTVDFAKLAKSLSSLLRGGGWSLNALLPELQTQSFDARKDLEMLLVHTQEAFVSTSLGAALSPLSGLLARCAAVTGAGGSVSGEPWFQDERLAAVLAETQGALALRLPETLAAVRLYLPPHHRGAVFAALQAACLDPLARLRSLGAAGGGADGAVGRALGALKEFVERTTAEML